MIAFALFSVLVVASVFSAKLLIGQQTERYQNPDLHEGRWVGPVLQGHGAQLRVTWERHADQWDERSPRDHRCRASTCTIGPGMAHLDVCTCGKTRSGVFGKWY